MDDFRVELFDIKSEGVDIKVLGLSVHVEGVDDVFDLVGLVNGEMGEAWDGREKCHEGPTGCRENRFVECGCK